MLLNLLHSTDGIPHLQLIQRINPVAVLGTARPWAEKFGAPTYGKKYGPNIIELLLNMCLICYRETK